MKLYEGFRNVPVEYLYEDHGIVYYRIGSGVFGFVPEKVSVDEFRDTVALMSDSMEKVQFLHENATLVGYDRTKMPKAMRGLYEARGRRRLREDDEEVVASEEEADLGGDEFEDAEDPLEGKSEEFIAGYETGYEHAYLDGGVDALKQFSDVDPEEWVAYLGADGDAAEPEEGSEEEPKEEPEEEADLSEAQQGLEGRPAFVLMNMAVTPAIEDSTVEMVNRLATEVLQDMGLNPEDYIVNFSTNEYEAMPGVPGVGTDDLLVYLDDWPKEAVAKLKYAVQRPFRREFAWRPRGPRMPVREVAGYSIKPADRRVIAAFLHKNAASGNGLESDGQKLRSTAMGRTLVAYWAKDDALYLGRPEGNVSQTWINAVKRAARDAGVQIWESRKRPIRERYGLRDRPPIRWASKKDAQQFVDIGWKSNNYESASSDAWDRAVDAVWDAYKSGVADEEQLSLIVKDELDRTATTERRLARSNYLASTDDSPNVEWKVKEAASQILGVPGEYISTTFEHGNWWVTLPNGAVYDVVDAEGGSSVNGFDLEMVTEPEEFDESKKPVKEADDTYQRGEEGEIPSEKLRYLRRMVRRLQNAGATPEEIETQISQEYPDVPEHLRQALLAGGGR